jgi:transcriptional regulator with XRE-family HTH domain
MTAHFGLALKDWRKRRRMSQLELGFAANVSARHIAFLETGRSAPSRAMVLQLSEALDVPRPARNGLLQAAGFAAAFQARPIEDQELAFVREAIDWALVRHEPYPAFALDRHWRLLSLNRVGAGLLQAVGLGAGDSLLGALVAQGPIWQAIDNRREVARHLAQRLRTESAHFGGDAVLDEAIAKLLALAGASDGAATSAGAVVATRYVAGDRVLSFFSTVAQFGTAEDIVLAEMKIEFLYPADEATRAALAG